MSDFDRTAHWQAVYTTKGEEEVSWFEQNPNYSLELIARAKAGLNARIVDVGGGASRLVDALVDKGQSAITVVDLSAAALATARRRLPSANNVTWVVSDITQWEPDDVYDVWHDRAAFHFLTDAIDQKAYVAVMAKALKTGGMVIIGTFARTGPDKCSGLPVAKHDATSLAEIFGPRFRLMRSEPQRHVTPWKSVQEFQFSVFEKRST